MARFAQIFLIPMIIVFICSMGFCVHAFMQNPLADDASKQALVQSALELDLTIVKLWFMLSLPLWALSYLIIRRC